MLYIVLLSFGNFSDDLLAATKLNEFEKISIKKSSLRRRKG